MANYQRFVSYLYEYQNNTKTKNCGFCRTELRDHHCRLEVHLKLPLYPFAPTLKVYAFVPSKEKLYGIFLGNASYQQGNVSGTFLFSEKNIMDSSYHFSQLGGIFLQSDTGLCFASAWKDIVIHPEHLCIDTPKEYEINCCLPSTPEEITTSEPELKSDQPTAPSIPALSPEAENVSDLSETLHKPSQEEIAPTLLAASTEATTMQPSPPNNVWEDILKSYPQCYPFFDDEIHICVQLSQTDIHKLEDFGYPISNNMFFRHNCQYFGHFLIGRNESHYLLAVPGIYHPKEQYIASMFGFPHFKPAQHPRHRNSSWGYWYRIIPEHWNTCKS